MAANSRPRRSILMGMLAATGLAGTGLVAKFVPSDGEDTSAVKEVPEALPVGIAPLFLDRYTAFSGGANRKSGDQSLLRGTLRDDTGEVAGELFASSVTMPGPATEGMPKTARMEFQNLHLADGTIAAMGTVFAQADLPNVYTIFGGTGRYAALRGTYRFDENPGVARPLGQATIVFDVSSSI